jgi:hypothetical protein
VPRLGAQAEKREAVIYLPQSIFGLNPFLHNRVQLNIHKEDSAMMRSRIRIVCVCVLCALATGTAGPARAGQLVVQATGVITEVNNAARVFDDTVRPGATFTDTFTIYDNTVSTGTPPMGIYTVIQDPGVGSYVQIGDQQMQPIVSTQSTLTVSPSIFSDSIELTSLNEMFEGRQRDFTRATLMLWDTVGNSLASGALPPFTSDIWDLSRWPNTTFLLSATDTDPQVTLSTASGYVTSLSASDHVPLGNPVPEPTTWALALSALVLCLLYVRSAHSC